MTNRRRSCLGIAVVSAVMLAAVACGGRSTATQLIPTPSQSPPIAVDAVRDSIVNDGTARTYVLVTPKSLDRTQRVPLVVVLHTTGGDAEEMRRLLRFDDESVIHGFAVVYPEALNRTWNTCCTPGPGYPDDVGFVKQLIDHLVAGGQIDAARVFVVGASAGGMMTHRLACELSDRLVAVASIGGQLTIDSCTPAHPISVVELHGSIDTIVPITNASSTMDRWADLNGCNTIADSTADGIMTTHVWAGCRGSAAVTMITFAERGHIWFGPDVPKPVSGPDVTNIIWSFFSQASGAV